MDVNINEYISILETELKKGTYTKRDKDDLRKYYEILTSSKYSYEDKVGVCGLTESIISKARILDEARRANRERYEDALKKDADIYFGEEVAAKALVNHLRKGR